MTGNGEKLGVRTGTVPGYRGRVNDAQGPGVDGGSTPRLLRAVPDPTPVPGRADRGRLVAELAQSLCTRVAGDGTLLEGAPHGAVALAIRDLVPSVDDADLDASLARMQAAADRVSAAETAADDDFDAYAAAAWEAGLDVADFPESGNETPGALFRAAVIEHWDLQLRAEVDRLLDAATPDPGHGLRPHRRTG